MVWFTVQLEDKPGSLARMADALAKKGINITSIVGVAEDTDSTLMLSTSDPAGTRTAFKALELEFEEHDPMPDLREEMSYAADLHGSSQDAGGRS